jgi:hypothetical protein
MTEQLAITKAGATARALGKSKMDCPYYKADAVPAATGESIEEWLAKIEAWELGWTAEDMMR